MRQHEMERTLSAIYLFSAIISLIAIISSAVVFANWSATLNYPCINDVSDGIGRDGYGLGVFAAGDCGCIFYGKAMAITSDNSYSFQGGSTAICHFIIFSSVPVLIVSLILGVYHAYRFCIVLPRKWKKIQRITVKNVHQSQWQSADEEDGEERALRQRSRGRSPQRRKIYPVKKRTRSLSPGGRRPRSSTTNLTVKVVSKPTNTCSEIGVYDDTFACWGPVAVIAALFMLFAFSTAVVATDGYVRTCSQWRRIALRTLSASGDLARAITTRLSCGAIFDLMDFLQPRKVINYGFTYEYGSSNRRIRDGDATIINTAIALMILIAAAWINVLCWVTLLVLNSKMAIERRKTVKTQGKSCPSLCCACYRK